VATDVLVLDVRLHGQTIGTLTRLPGDRNLFAFSQEYIDDRARATLSLSFKDAFGELITQMQPTQTRLLPFFSNLLPEGSMRDYLAKKAGVKSDREFYVAWALGRDLPGALRIRHSNEDSSWAEAATYADRDDVRGQALRFSLAGVELKFSAIKEATGGLTIPVDGVGGSWIVKLPSTRFPGVPENEFAMLELARRIGIDVPETKLIPTARIEGLPAGVPVAGDQALAIRRFDRSAAGGAIRLPPAPCGRELFFHFPFEVAHDQNPLSRRRGRRFHSGRGADRVECRRRQQPGPGPDRPCHGDR